MPEKEVVQEEIEGEIPTESNTFEYPVIKSDGSVWGNI